MAAFREPVSHAVDLRGASSSFADASSGDIRGYWRTFFRFDYAWRWGAKPHLHFPAGQEYTQTDEYIAIDGMGREFRDRRPFECTIDPTTGKFQTLYVQATDSICKLSNATWKRTVVRNVAPKFLRCANIPFQMIPTERVDSSSKYTGTDWLTVVVLWIPAVIYLFFAVSQSAELGDRITRYTEQNARCSCGTLIDQRERKPPLTCLFCTMASGTLVLLGTTLRISNRLLDKVVMTPHGRQLPSGHTEHFDLDSSAISLKRRLLIAMETRESYKHTDLCLSRW